MRKKLIFFTFLAIFFMADPAPESWTISLDRAVRIPGLSRETWLEINALRYTTRWSNGMGRDIRFQNRYNRHIASAQRHWDDIDPFILKSLLIQESSLRESHRRRYAGIAQLGRREARLVGLCVSRQNDQRLDPESAVSACVKVLSLKAQALESGGFKDYGRPRGDEYWKFIAAAYNAGEGTINRAMRLAYGDSHPNTVVFNDLLASSGDTIADSPLYQALIYSRNRSAKFRETKEFAENVVTRARQ
jgi:hypothetical protein